MQLGDKVEDTLTGFEGIVVGLAQYISGCNQALVKPRTLKEGAMVEGEWIDEQRLLVTRVGAFTLDNGATPGGPQHW